MLLLLFTKFYVNISSQI